MPEVKDLENNNLYTFGPFWLNVVERRLLENDDEIKLTPKVFDLLAILVSRAGHLQTRKELIETLWPTTIVEEHGLTWNMSALRKALGDEGKIPRYIETVRGQGYRFIAPVAAEEEATQTGLPSAPTHHRKRVLLASGALIAALVIVAGVLSWLYLAPAPTRAPTPPARSIAVLPFENLSTNPANAYFAAGIQDTILTKLSGIADLHVISRTSTEHYPSHPRNLRRIAHELGVATVLEGSVQKSGDQVLINVQLIDAATDNHIWAQAYTRALDNIFTVESDVAAQVASALKAKLLPAERSRIAKPPTRNPKAYDLFLRAEYLASRIERGSAIASQTKALQAAKFYRQAILRDPHFALAQARLSYLNSYLYWFGLYRFDRASRPQHLTNAQKEAKSALASDIPQAHLAMGYVFYWGHRDYDQALKQFKQALAGLPNNAGVIGAIALIHRRQGKWQKALGGLRQSEALDPRNPRWYYELGATLAAMRKYAEAREQFSHALAIDPENQRTYAHNAKVWMLSGKPENALQALKTTMTRDPELLDFTLVLRFEANMLLRKPQSALDILTNISTTWIEAPFTTGNVPTAALRAQAWQLQGNKAKTDKNYREAETLLRNALKINPTNPNLLSSLGMIEANLGNGMTAIHTARRATQLLPISSDALAGLRNSSN